MDLIVEGDLDLDLRVIGAVDGWRRGGHTARQRLAVDDRRTDHLPRHAAESTLGGTCRRGHEPLPMDGELDGVIAVVCRAKKACVLHLGAGDSRERREVGQHRRDIEVLPRIV